MNFSALNVEFNSASLDPLGLSRPEPSSVKNGRPFVKVVILPLHVADKTQTCCSPW